MYYKVFLEWKIGVNYNRYFFPGLFTKLGYDLLFFFVAQTPHALFGKKLEAIWSWPNCTEKGPNLNRLLHRLCGTLFDKVIFVKFL